MGKGEEILIRKKEFKSICNNQILRIYAIIGNHSVNGSSYDAFFPSSEKLSFPSDIMGARR